jgi:hypothetical protein
VDAEHALEHAGEGELGRVLRGGRGADGDERLAHPRCALGEPLVCVVEGVRELGRERHGEKYVAELCRNAL